MDPDPQHCRNAISENNNVPCELHSNVELHLIKKNTFSAFSSIFYTMFVMPCFVLSFCFFILPIFSCWGYANGCFFSGGWHFTLTPNMWKLHTGMWWTRCSQHKWFYPKTKWKTDFWNPKRALESWRRRLGRRDSNRIPLGAVSFVLWRCEKLWYYKRWRTTGASCTMKGAARTLPPPPTGSSRSRARRTPWRRGSESTPATSRLGIFSLFSRDGWHGMNGLAWLFGWLLDVLTSWLLYLLIF